MLQTKLNLCVGIFEVAPDLLDKGISLISTELNLCALTKLNLCVGIFKVAADLLDEVIALISREVDEELAVS